MTLSLAFALVAVLLVAVAATWATYSFMADKRHRREVNWKE